MPKSDLNAAVEKISERIARKVLRECKAFGTMGTWIKTLQDDNRMLKLRVKELEIRVKKLNTYGPTPPDPEKGKKGKHGTNTASSQAQKRKMTPAQMRKIRADNGFSQSQLALLLGIKTSRYSNWEYGHSIVPSEFEEKIREFRELKATELRTRMHNVGIFQPNGKTPSGNPTQAKENYKVITFKQISAHIVAVIITIQVNPA
jgi:DNA-binding transcriptional regulator YiaG